MHHEGEKSISKSPWTICRTVFWGFFGHVCQNPRTGILYRKASYNDKNRIKNNRLSLRYDDVTQLTVIQIQNSINNVEG